MNFRWLSWLASFWLALGPAAQAEPAKHDGAIVADYSADTRCPDRAEFERRVRARFSTAAPSTVARRFEVRLESGPMGAHGSLRAVGESAAPRALSAASCDEVADALALVAALMLEEPSPAASTRASANKSSAGGEAARSAPQAAPSSAPAAVRADEGAARVPEAAVAASESSAESAVAPDRAPADESATLTAPEARAAQTSAPPAATHVRLFGPARLQLSVAGGVMTGVAPNVRPGLSLDAALSAVVRDTLRLGARLGLRATLPDELRTEQGSARFAWLAGTGALCAEGPERQLRVVACAQLELGALRASGTASAAGHESTRFWGALGPSLGARLGLPRRLALGLSGELLGVLRRDRFFLADELVFSVPRLAYRLEIALSVTIL